MNAPVFDAYDPNEPIPLYLPGRSVATHVNHGAMWKVVGQPVDLGTEYLFHGWVKAGPDNHGSNYIASPGYGGAHAGMGLVSVYPGGAVNGNLNKGVYVGPNPENVTMSNFSYAGNYAPGQDEWVHIAVGMTTWNGRVMLVIWVNGVFDAMMRFNPSDEAGSRYTNTSLTGGGDPTGIFFVGGSDHSVWNGWLGVLQYWQGYNPLAGADLLFSFVPPRFVRGHARKADLTTVPCDFLCDYTRPGDLSDQSPAGLDSGNGYREFHHGQLYNATDARGLNTGGAEDGVFTNRRQYAASPLGTWIADPTCPVRRLLGYSPAPTGATYTPPATPAGALVFDSVSRVNSTFAFDELPSIGSTESGSRGPLPWVVALCAISGSPIGAAPNNCPFGRLGGRIVTFAVGHATGLVDLGTATQDVRVDRPAAATDVGGTAVAFRGVDENNHWLLGWIPGIDLAQGYGVWVLSKKVAGVTTVVDSATLGGPNTWTTLRATAVGNTINIYHDDGAGGWTPFRSAVTDAAFNTATKFGITTTLVPTVYLDGSARWDNITGLAG